MLADQLKGRHLVHGESRERTFVPAQDPALRARRLRRAVRVILIDPDSQILLFQDSDPGLPEYRWWVVPGGGIDPGETEQQTAIREVAEETGYQLMADDLIGPVARRHVVHGYSDQVLEQDEAFFIAEVAPFVVDVSAHTEDEKVTLQAHRWWSRAELAATDAWIWPAQLLELCDLASTPQAWPRYLGHQEESTVPDVPGEDSVG